MVCRWPAISKLALATVVVVVTADGLETGDDISFDHFITLFKRKYSHGSPEYEKRSHVFHKRVDAVKFHNAKPAGHRSWSAGVGPFADWTHEELMSLTGYQHSGGAAGLRMTSEGSGASHGGLSLLRETGGENKPSTPTLSSLQAHTTLSLKAEAPAATPRHASDAAAAQQALPNEVTWGHLHAFQHVRDQGQCGSCWAVASTVTLEAHYEIEHNMSRRFSVQELVSCTSNPRHCGGDGGCKGATTEIAFDFAMKHGMLLEENLPYSQVEGTCPTSLLETGKRSGARHSLGMWGWERVVRNDYWSMMRKLVQVGPLVTAVAAIDKHNGSPLVMYKNGIYTGCHRDVILDHAMVLFGYGSSGSMNYWQLQNSWGDDWGEAGTMRMIRLDPEEDAYCGTDARPQRGGACQGESSAVEVCGMCGMLYEGVVPHLGNASSEDVLRSRSDQSGFLRRRTGNHLVKSDMGSSRHKHSLRSIGDHSAGQLH